ncbi:MAG: galE [Frankiales bacterium]|jgi:UDP-glucose 4-epimerase|nr:galE [Frankiales bacterium]
MKLLVTGGAGYIGSIVTQQLVQLGHAVTVLDDLSTGHEDAVDPAAELVVADLHDAARVLTPEAGFQGVLHFAAKALVGEAATHPELYWSTNVAGSLALLEAMRLAGVPRLVFSSTCATYGQPDRVPMTEDLPTRPANAYGASKLAVDLMIRSYAEAHGLAAVSLRYFNVAGAYGGLGERHVVETHLIPNALMVASGDREALDLHGEDYPTPDGTCVRDYIHIDDLAKAHVLALGAAEAGRHQVYNLGTGTGFSVREVIAAVRTVTGHPVPVRVGPRRPGDPAALVASSALAERELGWRPQHTDLVTIVGDAWAFAQDRARAGATRQA